MSGGTVLLTGMFDMQNYGDLLFPLVARQRLGEHGHQVVAVAPTDARVPLADAMVPQDIGHMLSGDEPLAGIVIGGGYIVHGQPMSFLEDYDGRNAAGHAGPGLWLGATLAAALRDVPVAWNAPGVPHPFTTRQRVVVKAACRAASYLSVRDIGSAQLLGAPDDAPTHIVPDPIAGITALWPRPALEDDFRALLMRKGLPAETRLLAIHVRNRSMAGLAPAALGSELGALARTHGAVPMLVAVGRSHDDPGVARELAPHVGAPLLLLDDPRSLREITAALAWSAAYVGASLHGYVVSAAHGVPGVLLGRPAYRKFAGFVAHTGRQADLAADWTAALDLTAKRLEAPRHAGMPQQVLDALDRHWLSIHHALAGPDARRAQRQDVLSEVLRLGLDRDGPAWALTPFLNRAMRVAALRVHTPSQGAPNNG